MGTIAGSGEPGDAAGIGAAAQLNAPASVAIDADGSIVIADTDNHRIRRTMATAELRDKVYRSMYHTWWCIRSPTADLFSQHTNEANVSTTAFYD